MIIIDRIQGVALEVIEIELRAPFGTRIGSRVWRSIKDGHVSLQGVVFVCRFYSLLGHDNYTY